MKPTIRPLVASLLCVAIFPALSPAAELPVRTVILYKHGVGFFERSGTLGAGETAQLEFKASEMNDVLKSLTINDPGGNVKGLRYDSSIPLAQKLGEFPFAIEPGQPLSAVFDQLKGARLEMDFGTQKVAGAIVSARLVPGDRDHAEREQLTLLLDSGELRSVDLSAATSLKFSDPKLQLQFRDYLGALTGARSKEKRSVYIDSTDTKSREVKASYMMPMPAWKSSYRLLLGAESMLEGWAIVDNTTGEDWTNIHVSLISGKPISFISQLYAPKFIARKGAELKEDEAVAPVVYSGATSEVSVAAGAPPARFDRTDGTRLGQFAALQKAPAAKFRDTESVNNAIEASSVAISANGTEIADLFEYSIRNPITVKKNESAMLPFLQQKIATRKLIIYSDLSKPNPFNAAELTNNTGKTLDGGPITVYDAGTYAGEALVETMKAADKRFISYGVDLGTRVVNTFDNQNANVRELHALNGYMVTRSARVEKHIYSIKNVDARAKTLIIEHPLRGEYKLIGTAKPAETTPGAYRFEVKVPASGEVTFPVTEENVFENSMMLSNMTPDILLVYSKNKLISDAARRQIQAILDLKQKIVNVDMEKRRLEGVVTATTNDEQRVRQNIQSLSNVSGQQQTVQDYARKLAENEVQISKARDSQAQLDQQRATLQTQLNSLIEKLEF